MIQCVYALLVEKVNINIEPSMGINFDGAESLTFFNPA